MEKDTGKTPFFVEGNKLKVSKQYLEANRSELESKAEEVGLTLEGYLAKEATKKRAGTSVRETDVLRWTPEQLSKAAAVAENHGLSLNEFLSIVRHESAGTMSPSVTNSIGATGLIQFVPSTAADLLLKEQRAAAIAQATTPEGKERAAKENPLYWQLTETQKSKANKWAQKSIANLSVDRQLELTDLYLADRTKGEKGIEAVYTAIFTGKPTTKTIEKGTAAYKNNANLDKNNDGKLERDEWMVHVKNREPEVTAWLDGKEYKPDTTVQKRTAFIQKALQDKASAVKQTPSTLPSQSKQRAITKGEFFGTVPTVSVTNQESVDLMAALSKPVSEPEEPTKSLDILSTSATTPFDVEIVEAYGPRKDDNSVNIISPFG